MKFPVFSLLAGNLGIFRDEFAADSPPPAKSPLRTRSRARTRSWRSAARPRTGCSRRRSPVTCFFGCGFVLTAGRVVVKAVIGVLDIILVRHLRLRQGGHRRLAIVGSARAEFAVLRIYRRLDLSCVGSARLPQYPNAAISNGTGPYRDGRAVHPRQSPGCRRKPETLQQLPLKAR